MGYQRFEFLGNLGRTPELNYTPSGTAVCKFSVAVTEKYKDQETTEWMNCVAWGKTGEVIAEYLDKGSPILVTDAKVQTRSYEKDGQKRYVTEIVVRQFQFVGGGKRSETKKPEPSYPDAGGYDDSNDVPF